MHYAKELLERYWAFYRAERKPKIGFTSQGCTKPIDLACQILIKETQMSDEEMKDTIASRLAGLMKQIHNRTADGYWVASGQEERVLIQEFARFFVDEFFCNAVNRDRARLVGTKYRLLVNTCEFLYRIKADQEKQSTPLA
jgi:CRISPR type I-D-associated protein Csc3/Cas10d